MTTPTTAVRRPRTASGRKTSPQPGGDERGAYTPAYRDRWLPGTPWTKLPLHLKCIYDQLTQQPSVTRAGIVTLAGADVLAAQHPDVTAEQIETWLTDLEERGLIAREGSMLWICGWFQLERSLNNPRHLPGCMAAVRAIPLIPLRQRVATALLHAIAEGSGPHSPEIARLIEEFEPVAAPETPAVIPLRH